MNLYPYYRRLLFCLPPEAAHHAALKLAASFACRPLLRLFQTPVEPLPVKLWGLTFPNPVGLAAGFDRHGDAIDTLARLNFGFLEVGTVTPLPQAGNTKPRIFRLPDYQALINRIGFYSKGVDYLAARLQQKRYQGVLGVNIGKNRSTPVEKAAEDYMTCLKAIYPYADYVTINISSPNTPGLRDLQYGEALKILLSSLKETQSRLSQLHQRYVPLVLKLSPDLDDEQIAAIAEQLIYYEMDGAIATNTSLQRPRVQAHVLQALPGGLSGAPLIDLTVPFVHRLHYYLGDKVPIIALGGITSGDDAKALIKAGAKLVQLYTGLIYKGPQLISDAINAIRSL
ncbi:MAG: dihydroorotate oxidase [Gammaproteobacteria bacterium]|jgi:dihydroorotate dehydrogenase|nr:dihydroorotate oxidase [Gammaproteobacteria bacterium]